MQCAVWPLPAASHVRAMLSPPPPVQAQLETRTALSVVGRVSAFRRHACHAQELQVQILDLYHNEDAPPPPLAKTSADTADKARPRVGSNSYKA